MSDQPGGGAANPYAAPRAAVESGEGDDGDVMSREELDAFAGEAGSYYWERWMRSGRSTGLWPSWNWPAALVGPMWLAFRKLWREFLVAMVALLVWDFLVIALVLTLGLELPYSEGVQRLVFGLAYGLFGNAIFLRRARLEVGNVRRLIPDHPSGRLPYLANLGGTSGWWVVGAICASLALTLLKVVVLTAIVGASVPEPG